MLRRIGIGALVVSLVLILAGCAGSTSPPASAPTSPPAPVPTSPPAPTPAPTPTPPPNPKPSGPIEATWIEPQLEGDTVSIPVSEIEDNWNTHFKLRTEVDGKSVRLNFMAYILDGEIYVRANVCPPCRSVGYALENDILICDTCATTFNAKTGDGIGGACVDYPKATVPYEITNGQLVMNGADLITAYEDTLNPGWP
jgi:nitrite reductase/ring-hydroxylating ferredoxin subunit